MAGASLFCIGVVARKGDTGVTRGDRAKRGNPGIRDV